MSDNPKVEAQRERRDAAIAAAQAQIEESGSATFETLQRIAVEGAAFWLFMGDDVSDPKMKEGLYKLSVKALGEAVKAGRHLAKDHYREIKAELERRRGARGAFIAAKASTQIKH